MKSILSLLIVLVYNTISVLTFGQKSNWTSNFSNQKDFIENKGQFNDRNWLKNSNIEYAIDNNGFYVFFTKNGLTYRFDKIIKNPDRKYGALHEPKRINISEIININWLNSNENVKIEATDKNDAYYSYAIKNLLTKEIRNENHINGYNKLIYNNLYNNIDVEYESHPEKGIKYTLFVHPGADLSKVMLKYNKRHTNVKSEFINYSLDLDGNLEIKTSLGEIAELKPFAYYKDNKQEVKIKFKFENDILSFQAENYDNTRELVIDPWVVSPNFTTSSAVWEVETDGSGNVYVIGGETPMELKKYNSAGAPQWTYTTPWDTASVWLGTLATDNVGNSYITSGTTPEIQKINNSGGMVWQNSGYNASCEYWSITFNCDKSKLIVGGTYVPSMFSFDYYAAIYDIDINNGNVLGFVTFDVVNIFGGFGVTPIEVRSISSSKNAKYIFLTHKDVGAINQNISMCPSDVPVFKLDNGHNLSYKCENYLPATQNGGGLKAIIANDQFFYTHSGTQIFKRSITDGTLISTANVPGGGNQSSFGGIAVENSGLAVDNCGNVYAGSINNVVQFDANLNILSQVAVGFTVYDLSVNSNGEVVAVGAQFDNQSAARNGQIQAINFSACPQYSMVCCDANVCNPGLLCTIDPPINLIPSTPGGIWSGIGITNSATGTFDPSVAGVGTHTIVYTVACGSDSINITVLACSPINVCFDGTNLIASGGSNTISWETQTQIISTPSNAAECIACGGTPIMFLGNYISCNPPICTATAWTAYTTGNISSLPNSWPLLITDGVDTTIYNSQSEIPSCNPCTPPTLTNTLTNVTCAGGSNGAINLTVTGSSTYTYSWTGPLGYTSTIQDPLGLAAGTYNVTVTDASNSACTATSSIIVNPGIANPTPTITGSTTFCTGGSSILDAGSYTSYTWSTTATSQTITVNTAGTYSVTVTNASGCTGIASVVVTVSSSLTSSITGSTSFCTGGSTTLDAGSYTAYLWSDNSTLQTLTVTAAGTYSVTVTDASGCTGIASVVITISSGLTPSITGSTSFCTGGSTTLNAGSYTAYLWSDNSTLQTLNVTAAGTYSVTVTDASGCTGIASVVITINSGLTPSITGSTSFCTGGSTTLDAGSGYASYLWSNNATTQTINVTTAGTYSVTVASSSCVASGIELVNNGDFSTGNIGFTSSYIYTPPPNTGEGQYWVANGTQLPTWNGGMFTNGDHTSGSGNFMFVNGSGTPNTDIWCQTITVTPNTNYLFSTWVSSLNNSNPAQLQFSTNGIPLGSVFNAPAAWGTWQQFSASWNSGANTSVTICIVNQNTNVGGNDFGLDDISFQICNPCTGSTSVNVTVNSNPSPTITGSTSFCSGSSTTLDAGSGYNSYLWSNNGTTQTINVTTAGTYSVTVTNASGCTGTASVTVTLNSSLSPVVTGSNFCTGSSSILDAGSGFLTYSWSQGGNTQTITVNTPNTYIVTVTDATGCSGTGQIIISENSLPVANAGVDQTICTGSSATLTATGGSTYAWSNAANTASTNVSPTSTTTYTVTVTDLNSCSSSDSVIVSVISSLTSDFTTTQILCTGGTSTVTYTGNCTGNCIFNWSFNGGTATPGNGQGPHTVSWLDTGANQVSLTVSLNGCSSPITTNTVVNPTLLSATATTIDAICYGQINGSVDLTVTGGTPPYQYLWNNITSTEDLANVGANDYTVLVTDSNGCTISASATVNQPTQLTVSTNPSVSICNGEWAYLTATATGGNPQYSYYWNNVLSNQSIGANPTSQTNYSVYVTDSHGCTSNQAIVVVNVSPILQINVTASPNSICPGDTVNLNVDIIQGGGPPYMIYNLNGDILVPPIYILPTVSGPQYLFVKDGCGSIASDSVYITVNSIPNANFVSDSTSGCQPLTVSFNPSYAQPGEIYLWSFGDASYNEISFLMNPVHEFASSGTFNISLTVTSPNGCKSTFTHYQMITVFPRPFARFIANPSSASIIKPQIFFSNLSELASFYIWTFGDGDSSSVVNPMHWYSSLGSYMVQLIAISDKGCTDTTRSAINIRDEYTFYAPTAISPDLDNINDIFFVLGNGISTKNFHLFVFDRWGEIIYQTDKYDTEHPYKYGWDGSAKGGAIVSVGSYTWLVKYYDGDHIEHVKSGVVNVIR